jgi:hypothetical protein
VELNSLLRRAVEVGASDIQRMLIAREIAKG